MFKYIILGLVLSFNAAAADLSLDTARESIGSSLNNVVREIKQLFNESAEDLNNVETKDIDNKARVESLKQKSEESESNPTVLKHAKKAIPDCDYNSKNLVWDGSAWKCVKMQVDTECQAAAPDEYMYKDANGNNVCAKSPKGSSINYYYKFRGYSSKCTGAYSGYEKLYDCVYKNKLGQVIDVDAGNCSGKSKPSQANKLCAKAWSTGAWGSCSKSCGGGTKSRSVYCQSGYDCSMYSQPTSTMSCNTQKCAGTWTTGSWSSCSATACGTTGTQTRSVSCPANLDCSGSPRPASSQSCYAGDCGQCTWTTSAWSSCSATACGTTGTQTRTVSKTGPAGCLGPTTPQPTTTQSCSAPACQFKGCGSYSRSITECGKHHGVVRSRNSSYTHGATESVGVISSVDRKYEVDYRIKCNNGSWQTIGSTSLFNYQTGESYKCASEPAKSYIWMQHPWGTCSKSCGGGVQYRTVNCVEISDPRRPVVSDSICYTKLGTKPKTSQSCNTQSCGGTWVKDGQTTISCTDTSNGGVSKTISYSDLGKHCNNIGERAVHTRATSNCSWTPNSGPGSVFIYYARCR
jgi:hypothetical protein